MACPLRTDRFSAVFYPGRSIVPPLLSTPGAVASCRKIESPGWRWKAPWRLSGNGPWRSWRGGRCVCVPPQPQPLPPHPHIVLWVVCVRHLCVGVVRLWVHPVGPSSSSTKLWKATRTHTLTLSRTHTHTHAHTCIDTQPPLAGPLAPKGRGLPQPRSPWM